MLRLALRQPLVRAPVRASQFSTFSGLYAKAAPPGGKNKAKQGFGNKKKGDPTKTKTRKAGMTHLKFRDAVRQLGYEKNAPALNEANFALGTLNAKALVDEEQQQSVVKYDAPTMEKLVALKSFKKFQYHEMFSQPTSMITDNTRALYEEFVQRAVGNGEEAESAVPSSANRVCLIGEKGVGKSTLMTQVQALALSQAQNNVILLHFDHPDAVTNGTSDYIFNPKLNKYQQPMFTKRWIIAFRKANEKVLKQLALSQDVTFINKKKEKTTLKSGENTVWDFVEQNHDFGKVGPTSAFQTFVKELQHHSANVPVVVTVDNVNAVVNETVSKYFHPDYTPIHLTEFEMGSFLVQVLSGEVSFARGGVLMAESSDNSSAHTLNVGLGLEEYDPYYTTAECDYDVASGLLSNGGLRTYQLANLTKDETRDLIEFWESAGVLQLRDYPRKPKAGEATAEAELSGDDVFEKAVHNSYTLTSGNVGGLVNVTNFSF
ncbi:37S ribosomal protein S23, mitochondrial [[Candida] railenensis]|uniref:Small ribosomal subunit protein mS29 n=1 Tax=[Candida] railenensis TaxID=45579 RepID=A0A9P0QVW4_9ASCO|nr:37S ribosomal protein S23, mitochondrial [[Candida] railenensis]